MGSLDSDKIFEMNFAGLDDVNNYTGHSFDGVIETYFAQARVYEPDVRRFLAEDIIKDEFNWYSYVDGNPLSYVDPDGRSIILTIVAGAVISGTASSVIKWLGNVKNSEKWSEGIGKAFVVGAATGALTSGIGVGVGLVADKILINFAKVSISTLNKAIIVSSTREVLGSLVTGEINSIEDLIKAIVIGGVNGVIEESVANIMAEGLRKYFLSVDFCKQKDILREVTNTKVYNSNVREVRRQLQALKTPDDFVKYCDAHGAAIAIKAIYRSC